MLKLCVLLHIALFGGDLLGYGQVIQLLSPDDLSTNRTTLFFDEHSHDTPGNTLYETLGLTFGRDDGGVIPIIDLVSYGFQSPSPNNILFTGLHPAIGSTQTFATHLIANSLQPLMEIGAFFGNDQYIPEYAFTRMSIFGTANELLGSLDVTVNNNGHVDQFIGLRSAIPFYRVRFENFTVTGVPSPGYGVALDDLAFTPVPEPSAGILVVLGVATLLCIRAKRDCDTGV